MLLNSDVYTQRQKVYIEYPGQNVRGKAQISCNNTWYLTKAYIGQHLISNKCYQIYSLMYPLTGTCIYKYFVVISACVKIVQRSKVNLYTYMIARQVIKCDSCCLLIMIFLLQNVSSQKNR